MARERARMVAFALKVKVSTEAARECILNVIESLAKKSHACLCAFVIISVFRNEFKYATNRFESS